MDQKKKIASFALVVGIALVVVLAIVFYAILLDGPSVAIAIKEVKATSISLDIKAKTPSNEPTSAFIRYRLKGAGKVDPNFWNDRDIDLEKQTGFICDFYEAEFLIPHVSPGQTYQIQLVVDYGDNHKMIESDILEPKTPKTWK